MKPPYIMINGNRVEPAPPKMKVWRAFLRSAEKLRLDATMEDFLNEQIELIVIAFGKPDVVNKDTIDDNLEISEVVPMVRKLYAWIQSLTLEKLQNLPNAVTEGA